MKPAIEHWLFIYFGVQLELPSYALMFALAVMSGCLIFIWHGRHKNLSERFGYRFLCLAVPFLLGGAKIVYWMQFPQVAEEGVDYWLGRGAAMYGGLLGVAVAAVVTSAWFRIPFRPYLDGLGLALSGGLIIGRLGCFLAGCNHGSISSLPWAVRFPAGSHAFNQHLALGLVAAGDRNSLPVHPTQLYEAGIACLLLLVGLLLIWKKAPDGLVFVALLGSYALFRFLVEFVRADQGGTYWGPFTFAQVVSLLVIGMMGLLGLSFRGAPAPLVAPETH